MLEEGIIGHCQRCTEEVPDGEACVTVNLHTEIIDRGIVDVKDARAAVLLCTDCGVGLSEAGLRQAVADHLDSLEGTG